MPRILFVAAHRPNRSPSQRFRFEQYLDFLNSNGFECEFSWLVNHKDDSFLYRKGFYFRKFLFLLKSYKIRFKDLAGIRNFDIVYVQREALMFRSAWFEKAFARRTKLVFDFDDAIWLMDVSEGNKNWRWLKNPGKTAAIISSAHLVFAGNPYLADYAKQFNSNVVVMPTTVDTSSHKPGTVKQSDRICIGWTGSLTTIKHLKMAEPVLLRIKEKYGERVYFKVIGETSYKNETLGIRGLPWKYETEVQDLTEMDIGIMPLPDDKWAKGKCGFKGLQYMALEIPTVMSPVGVNTEIISDGLNGFLATTEDEWFERLSQLIDSPELRKRIGVNGRQTVVEKYSFDSQKENYLKYFNGLLKI